MKKFYSLLKIALKSAWNRRSTLFLIICAIAISTALLLGIEKIRTQVKENFVNSVVGTDLIIGARTSQIQLLLYSVFHIGSATSNMGYETLQKISRDPKVSWVIPVSLGDSHKSFPVVATDENFFKHFRYADRKEIRFRLGNAPAGMFDVAIGNEVAEKRLSALIRFDILTELVISAVFVTVSFGAAPAVVRLFMKDPAIVSAGTAILRAAMISQPAVGVVLVCTTLFQAEGRALPAFVLSLARQGFVLWICLAVFSRAAGLPGILYSQALSDGLTLLVSLAFLRGSGRRRTEIPEAA